MRSVAAVLLLLLSHAGCSSDDTPAAEPSPETDIANLLRRIDTLPPTQFPLDSLVAAAESVYFRGEIDGARMLLNAAHRGGIAQENVAVEARALTWLGLASWRLGDYRAARELGEQALQLKLRHDLTDQLFRSYNALGLLAWNEGRLTDAAKQYERASAAAAETNDERATAAVAGNLALVRTELGEFAAARTGFEEMRRRGRALDDARIEGNALTNLGMLDVRVGNPRRAIRSLDRARELYGTIGYVTGEQNALGQLGTAYRLLGETSMALAALDSAYQQARAQGLRQDEASDLELLAELYQEAGDHVRALRFLGQAKEINAELGLQVELGADLRREAEIHMTLDDLARATEYAAEALMIHAQVGARLEELWDRLILAELADRSNRSSDARRHVVAAHALVDQLDARIARVELALVEARIADRHQRSGDVLDILDQARDDLSAGGYWAEWLSQLFRSRAFERMGRLPDAAEAGRAALAAVERVRSNYGSSLLRTSFTADKSAVYEELVSILLQLGEVDEAFGVADAARGRALLEHVASAADTSLFSTSLAQRLVAGDAILREIDQLVESIDYLEAIPPAERDSAQLVEIDRLYTRLREHRSRYETVMLQAAEASEANAAFLGGARVRVEGVQQRLGAGELLIDYLLTDDRLVLFAVTSAAIRSFESEITRENLVSRVRVARGLVGSPGASRRELRAALGGLHRILFGPVVRSGMLDRVRRLIVVPHGALSYLPFAALIDPASGRYLVEDFAMQFLPSAAALPVVRPEAQTRVRPAVAAARVFAPLPDLLPASRREARAVGRALEGSRSLIGDRASEPRLRNALEQPGFVHLATHGVMNVRNPLFSRLELTPTRDAGMEHDGRFEVHELLQLTVRSSLVFLSGCETGIGSAWTNDLMQGEDYATLAQGFLYAGARNVIATLWPIDDEGAAVFAEGFYRRLAGSSPAAALAGAQRELISHEAFNSPYYWAAYQLAGSGAMDSGV